MDTDVSHISEVVAAMANEEVELARHKIRELDSGDLLVLVLARQRVAHECSQETKRRTTRGNTPRPKPQPRAEKE